MIKNFNNYEDLSTRLFNMPLDYINNKVKKYNINYTSLIKIITFIS